MDWQMTWLNLLALATMGLGMKAVAFAMPLRVTNPRSGPRLCEPQQSELVQCPETSYGSRSARFIASPVLAPNSLERSQPLSALPSFFLRAGACLGALLLYCWIYWKLVDAFHFRGIVLGYLVAPAVLLTTEVFVAIITILWLPSGHLLPVLHRNPFAARSVADFWGRRWNLWMSEWFRFAIFTQLRRRPVLAVWLIFSLSGLLHEYVLNLGLWLVTGQKLFGTMMLYFLLQAAGMFLERRFLKHHPRANILFTWLIVFLPVPLVFHESMLRTLHLWPN
jgi:hypothetical protein